MIQPSINEILDMFGVDIFDMSKGDLYPLRNEFEQIGPRLRKTYYQPKSIRVWGPPRLQLIVEPRSPGEMNKYLNTTPLPELSDQAGNALRQMVIRACAGDTDAMVTLVDILRCMTAVLNNPVSFPSSQLQSVAEERVDWPVLLSDHPQEIKYATGFLRTIKVGAKLPRAMRPTSRIRPHDFWTQIAHQAYWTCYKVKHLIPRYLEHTKDSRVDVHEKKYWGTKVSTKYYFMETDRCIIITDWQAACARLPDTIIDKNFEEWWKTMKMCILEYWQNEPGKAHYKQALSRIRYSDTAKTDKLDKNLRGENIKARQRAHALQKIKRAFRQLVIDRG